MKKLFLLIVLFSGLAACTVQKRTVNRGYFVQWHWQKYKGEKAAQSDLPSGGNENNLSANAEPGTEKEATSAQTENLPVNEGESLIFSDKPLADEAPEQAVSQTPKAEKKHTPVVEHSRKSAKTLRKAGRNILDDFALVYVVIAGILILLAVLFLIIGLNVGYIADTIFLVLSVTCFVGAILVLAIALLLWLFSNSIRSGKKKK